MTTPLTRRGFLADSGRATIGGTLAMHLPWLAALASCRRSDEAFSHLTPAEVSTLRAFAAQIIPSDRKTPGAAEAGVEYFVDRAFEDPWFRERLTVLRSGLADLDVRARQRGAPTGFASLGSDAQIALMKEVEREPFFAVARTLVIMGTFASPRHGGNRDETGWTIVGVDHSPTHSAPFGWYDAQARRIG
jgi:hypothetical protein